MLKMKKTLFVILLGAAAFTPARAAQANAAEEVLATKASAAGKTPAAPIAPIAPIAPVARKHSAEESLAALRPVLTGRRYLEQIRKRLAVQLARLGGGGSDSDDPDVRATNSLLVTRTFVADVRIIYVLDFEEGAQLVSYGMMKSWGMDLDRLHQRALANLDRIYGDITTEQVGKLPWLYVIDTDDGYAASRVLLHWRWGEMTLKYGESLILGMPSRDVVVFTATLKRDKLEQLGETVEVVERYQDRPVTRKLFQWTPQGWLEFDPSQAGDASEQLSPPSLERGAGGRPITPLQQTQEQSGQGGEQQNSGEGEVIDAPAKAQTDVAGQAADAQQSGQSRQENAGDEHRDE